MCYKHLLLKISKFFTDIFLFFILIIFTLTCLIVVLVLTMEILDYLSLKDVQWASWFSGIFTLIAVCIAYVELNNWKAEKKSEIEIAVIKAIHDSKQLLWQEHTKLYHFFDGKDKINDSDISKAVYSSLTSLNPIYSYIDIAIRSYILFYPSERRKIKELQQELQSKECEILPYDKYKSNYLELIMRKKPYLNSTSNTFTNVNIMRCVIDDYFGQLHQILDNIYHLVTKENLTYG